MNWKIIVTVLGFLYCLYYLDTINSGHFIDGVDLVIHEAGHLVFSFFGYFITIAGGTLLQLIVPIVFIAYFILQNQKYSASLLMYWLAINLFNVSVYAGDALKMQLPLLTGDKDGHDWNQMLFTLGWLKHTYLISNIIFAIGIITMIFALLFGLYCALKSTNDINENSQIS